MRHALIIIVLNCAPWLGAGQAEALLCVPILGCSCNVTASDVDFGSFDPLSGAHDALGEIEVDCTGVVDVAPTISARLSAGQWGPISARKMRSGAGDLLDYNLYTNAARTIVWGDGTGGSSTVTISGGLLAVQHWTVSRDIYARAAPALSTKPGAYSDTVLVRIVW